MARPAASPSRAPLLLKFAMLIALCACAGRGSCVSGETVFETHDGAIRMELVRDVHWGGGRMVGPINSFAVRIHTDPPFDESVLCDHVDMFGDDAGQLVAFRCQGTGSWTVVRLFGGDRHVRECDAPVGMGAQPAFADLDPLSESVERIFECAEHRSRDMSSRQWSTIVAVVEEREGTDEALALVQSNARRELADWAGGRVERMGAWEIGIAALSPSGRARALTAQCANLTRRDVTDEEYAFSARRCALDSDMAAVALARLRTWAVSPREPSPAVFWASVVAMGSPEEAGAFACTESEALDPLAHSDRAQLLATILADTRTSCEALDGWLDHVVPCHHTFATAGALITEAQLRGDRLSLQELHDLDTADQTIRARPSSLRLEQALLTALYQRETIPEEIRRRVSRLSYERPTGDLPECSVFLNAHLCDVPSSQSDLDHPRCSYTIDDGTRRIMATHR